MSLALACLLSSGGCDAADDASAEPSESAGETSELDATSSASSAAEDGDHDAGETTGAEEPTTSGDDGAAALSDASTSTEGGGGEDTSASSDTAGQDTTTANDTGASTEDGTNASTGSPVVDGLPLHQDFAGNDGASWPAPWSAVGEAVLIAEIVGDAGRLSGAMGYVARMILPGFEVVDVDATIVVEFEDASRQGIGFYARQNGGVLLETAPPGQGYCVYVEGEGEPNLGIWREQDGVEQILSGVPNPIPGGIEPGVGYALRLQIVQSGNVTELRAKMWRADEAEPPAWAVDIEDATAELQGTPGSFAVDVYNYDGTGSVYVDDIFVIAP